MLQQRPRPGLRLDPFPPHNFQRELVHLDRPAQFRQHFGISKPPQLHDNPNRQPTVHLAHEPMRITSPGTRTSPIQPRESTPE